MRFAISCMAGVPVSREMTFLANQPANRIAATPQMSTGSEYSVRGSKTPPLAVPALRRGSHQPKTHSLNATGSAQTTFDLKLERATVPGALPAPKRRHVREAREGRVYHGQIAK